VSTAAAQTATQLPGGLVTSTRITDIALSITDVELAGNPNAAFPFFDHVQTFHEGEPIYLSIDTKRYPMLVGRSTRVFVTADRDATEWHDDPALVDVRGAVQFAAWTSGSITANTFVLDNGALSGIAGDHVGRGYDVVLDVDGDQELGFGDFIDGREDTAGMWVVHDTGALGPHAVTEVQYSGGAFLGQDLFYPSDIAGLRTLPLVVVSHGNGHDYRWYDHIGRHLASNGAIVMSHQNDTVPGPESASVTTIANTEYLLANLSAIASGALRTHVDQHHIVWIGHSRGGEGVVRAYRKLKDGTYVSPEFTAHDIALIVCMAPTTQLTPALSDPGSVPIAIFYGGADTDVSSAPFMSTSKPLAMFERAQGDKFALYLHGVGHADWHNGGGPCWCAGPSLIGASATHDVLRGYLRALVGLYAQQDGAAREFTSRSFQDFHPPSIPANVVVASEFLDARAAAPHVIDDFESQAGLQMSSSGGAVAMDVLVPVEGDLTDFDNSLVYSPGTPMNGMVLGRRDESPHGLVFEWDPTQPRFVEFQVLPNQGNVRDLDSLSLRAAQGTRHPQTDALDADLDFSVTLRDQAGHTATVQSAEYASIVRTYGRMGVGAGAGWINEFCTLRIPLEAFTAPPSRVNLGKVRAIRLDFGASYGAARGRLGIDDIEFAPRRTP
jgi:dienelactone hydrolase